MNHQQQIAANVNNYGSDGDQKRINSNVVDQKVARVVNIQDAKFPLRIPLVLNNSSSRPFLALPPALLPLPQGIPAPVAAQQIQPVNYVPARAPVSQLPVPHFPGSGSNCSSNNDNNQLLPASAAMALDADALQEMDEEVPMAVENDSQ